jgi:uncharacterized 2Fe-2S/4Fe-4S cluster protein (DUF4445 family)
VRKRHVELPEPTLSDDAADLLRLERQIGPFEADLDALRNLATLLRGESFRGTAVLSDHRLIDFERGDTTRQCYGVAFDIGTTTVAGTLVDLNTGEEKAVGACMNPQVRFGDDVLSRIRHASENDEGREELRDSVLSAVGQLVEELCGQAKIVRRNVYEATFAGNTTMQHLLCGLDVEPLGVVPFAPTCARGVAARASQLGLRIHPRAMAYVFPVIGGFVGGDTVAGLLATRLAGGETPSLMVDIGTNGEIVLAHDGKVWAASTAAGPAFEGARIACGMRASRGAIEKIVLDDDLRVSVIGNAPPVGLCGSALVDAVGQLLARGAISPEGRLLQNDELPDSLPEAIRRRITPGENGQGEVLLADGTSAGGGRVVLTQRDIRELQLASGAIRAGITLLLRQAGLEPADLQRVCIAGGFGSFIRRNHAQRIGLIPPGIDHTRIHYVGNVSLKGARWALLSTHARARAEQIARESTHVELSQDFDFQAEFAEAMIFPEPEDAC